MIREWNFQMHRVSLSEEIFEKRLDQSEGVSHRSLLGSELQAERQTGITDTAARSELPGAGLVGPPAGHPQKSHRTRESELSAGCIQKSH